MGGRGKVPRVHSAFILSICEQDGQHLNQRRSSSGRDPGPDPLGEQKEGRGSADTSVTEYSCSVGENGFRYRTSLKYMIKLFSGVGETLKPPQLQQFTPSELLFTLNHLHLKSVPSH